VEKKKVDFFKRWGHLHLDIYGTGAITPEELYQAFKRRFCKEFRERIQDSRQSEVHWSITDILTQMEVEEDND